MGVNRLKKVYNSMPICLQNYIDELWYHLPQSIKLGSEYNTMFALLKERDKWSRDRILSWQNDSIKKLLVHAFYTCKFYNRLFKEAGFNPNSYKYTEDLLKVPSIDKLTVQQNLNDMLSDAFSEQDRYKLTTGGTSGNQMIFFNQKRFTFARERAFYDYLWGKFDYVAGKSERVIFRNEVLKKKLWRYNYREHTWVIDTYHLTDENCDKIIDKLNEIKVNFFHVYPSAVLILADYMHRKKKYLAYTPKAIFATSENLYRGQREVIESAFGCRLLMSYGHSEMCCLAYEKLDSNFYHLEDMYGYTELLDSNQYDIKLKGQMGEITATGFNNYVLPLIRYRTADYAAYAEDVSSNKERVLLDIEGRWQQEMLVTSKNNKISMTSINFHSDIFDNIKGFQFYQDKPGLVTMKIVKGDGYSTHDEQAIKQAMQEKLGEYMQLCVEYVNKIEKAPNGKFRYIISKISVC